MSLIKVEMICTLRQLSDFERWTKPCWTFKEITDLLDACFQICKMWFSFSPRGLAVTDVVSLYSSDVTWLILFYWHDHSMCLQRNKEVLDIKIFTPIATVEFLKNEKPTRSHLLFYYTAYRLNMFRALLCPSSGARDYNVDYHIGRFVLGLLYVGG